jgi:twitching motility protein PilI
MASATTMVAPPASICNPFSRSSRIARQQDGCASRVVATRPRIAVATVSLSRLGDAAEVVAVPAIAKVPLTRPWFLGLANVRGESVQRHRLAAFIGREAAIRASGADQVILFGRAPAISRPASSCRGARSAQTSRSSLPQAPEPGAPAWYGQRWLDADGGTWQEIESRAARRRSGFSGALACRRRRCQ